MMGGKLMLGRREEGMAGSVGKAVAVEEASEVRAGVDAQSSSSAEDVGRDVVVGNVVVGSVVGGAFVMTVSVAVCRAKREGMGERVWDTARWMLGNC